MAVISAKEQHVKTRLERFLYEPVYERSREKYLAGAKNVQDLLHGLYGDEINHIEGILPESLEGKNTYTSILNGFYALAFDTGLSRNISFEYRGRTMQADSVYMLRRSAFLERTRKKIDEMESKKAAFLMLDVADVGFADMIEDDRRTGVKSADLLLNRFAGTLQKALDETERELNDSLGKNTISLMAGRYGGDEFVVSVLGNYDDDVLDMVKRNIQKRISELKNQALYKRIYFRNGQEDIEDVMGDIRLKNGSIEVIELPTVDQYSQRIFSHYLRQGLIMNQNQIDIIKTQYRTEDFFEKNVIHPYESRFKYYEGDRVLTTVEEKIRYILKRHPELRLAFNLAESLDEAETILCESEVVIRRRQEYMLHFVQTTLFDPLLGYGVYSYHDFREHATDEPISQVMIFDLKLKELNDLMGLAFTDGMVDALWIQIRESIDKEDIHKIIFGRRGGTFYLAVKEGKQISSASLEKLSTINTVPFKFGQISIPVGTAGIEEPMQGLENEAEQTKANFYRKIIEELIHDPRLVTILQTPEQPHNKAKDYNTADFYWRYFWGTRFYFRSRDIIRYIPQDRHDLIEIFHSIIRKRAEDDNK